MVLAAYSYCCVCGFFILSVLQTHRSPNCPQSNLYSSSSTQYKEMHLHKVFVTRC